MAPVKPGRYEYKPESLVRLRQQMQLTQASLAKALGVPANTVSRWETGGSTPDAESLAAVYSIAVKHGVTPSFFQRRKLPSKRSKKRSRLLVMWDFQNMPVSAEQVKFADSQIRNEISRRLKGASYQRFKAFADPSQEAATERLQDLGWRVWEDDTDMDDELISQARSDCGQEPADTSLVLITADGDYIDLVDDLKNQGVVVYLLAPEGIVNQRLVEAVGQERYIGVP